MELIAWMLSLVIAFAAGSYISRLRDTVNKLQESIKEKVDKPPVEDESKSRILDPDDFKREAQLKHDLEMRLLNK